MFTGWGACPHTMRTTATALYLRGGVLLSCLSPFHASQARRHNVEWDMPSHITGAQLLLQTSTCCPESPHQKYGAAFTARTSAPNNWQTSDTALITTSPWKAAYTHAIVSSQPPSLSCVSPQKLVSRSGKNQWEATQNNLKKCDIHPKEQLPSGDTLP